MKEVSVTASREAKQVENSDIDDIPAKTDDTELQGIPEQFRVEL